MSALTVVVLAACTTTVAGSASPQTRVQASSSATSSTSSSESTSTGSSSTSSSASSSSSPSAPLKTTVRIGLDTSQFYSYNQRTYTGYSFVGQNILTPVLPRFNELDESGATLPVTEVGSYEVVSTDPYVLEYTLSGEWSDGVPVTFADFLLAWAADGSGLRNEDGSPLFNNFDYLWERVDEPKAEMDATTFQLTFNEATPLNSKVVDSLMPAHIALEQSGVTPAEFAAAVAAKDVAALTPVANFYNTAWEIPSGQDVDTSLMLSAGPYQLSEINADGTVVLIPNDEWAGEKGAIERIEFVPITGDEQLETALAAGDIDLAAPSVIDPETISQTFGQLSEDTFSQASGFSNSYEHLDFNIAGIFADPLLRKAFVACVPREQMLEQLITPLDPTAAVLQSSTVPQWSEEYADYARRSPGNEVQVDIAAAQALLDQAGKVGQAVTLTTTAAPRRQKMTELIKDSCDKAGFEVTIDLADNIFTEKLPTGEFEVALFGWQSNGGYTDLDFNLTKDGPNNFGKYDNPQVEDLLTGLQGLTEAAEYEPILEQIDAILWADLPTLPLFSLPAVQYWDADLTGPQLARDGIFTRSITQWRWQ